LGDAFTTLAGCLELAPVFLLRVLYGLAPPFRGSGSSEPFHRHRPSEANDKIDQPAIALKSKKFAPGKP
jgi:hypothetical protein